MELCNALREDLDEIRTEWRSGIFGHVFPDGRFLPAIAGGDGTGSSGEGDEEEEEGEEEDDEDDDASDVKDPTARIAALENMVRRRKAREREAKTARDEALAKLKAQEDEKKGDLEKAISRAEEAESQLAATEAKLKETEIELKILGHDELSGLPSTRRELIARQLERKLEIEDDGESNLDELVKDLKDKDPDLFKTVKSKSKSKNDDEDGDEDDDDEEEEEEKVTSGGKKTNKKTKKGGIDDEALRKRFPAIRR